MSNRQGSRSLWLRHLSASISYKVDETRMLEAPAPPPPETYYAPPREEEERGEEIIETVTTKIIENPTPSEIDRYERAGEEVSVAGSRRSRKSRKSRASRRSSSSSSSSTTRQTVLLEEKSVFEEKSIRSPSPAKSRFSVLSKSRAGRSEAASDSLTLILPEREKRGKSRSRRKIDEEIEELESQKRLIRRERRTSDDFEERSRDEEYEIVEADRDIRVERGDRGEPLI